MSDQPRRGLGDRVQHSRFTVPAFAVLMGVVVLVLQGRGGDWRGGLVSLGIMVAFGAVVLFGGRSETIRGLRGDGRDERMALMDLRATAFAGYVLIVAVIAGFLVELARGHDGSPYTLLGAITGVAYVVAIVIQRLRA